MSPSLILEDDGRQIVVCQSGGPTLFQYVYVPQTRLEESRRPYLHPVYSIDGDVLTCFRPNDHPWHHALSLTLTSVGGVNFWGGPSFRTQDRYAWRQDQGVQVHLEWLQKEPGLLEHVLEWRDESRGGRRLLLEHRQLRIGRAADAWSLEWRSRLENVTGARLQLDNYHSAGGLAGSHYTGLQFRGARGLLDQHGDPTIALVGEAGDRGEAALQGQRARWVEWHAQHDGSLHRTRVRFENLGEPIPWFVRETLPLVAFAPHREQSLSLDPAAVLELAHRLTFARA